MKNKLEKCTKCGKIWITPCEKSNCTIYLSEIPESEIEENIRKAENYKEIREKIFYNFLGNFSKIKDN